MLVTNKIVAASTVRLRVYVHLTVTTKLQTSQSWNLKYHSELISSGRARIANPRYRVSDRGLQYCSNEYQKLLKENNIKTSMTEQYDPYENAVAERINGILKQEFGVARPLKNINEKSKLIEQSVQIYNQERPHLSNNMLTPNQMHKQSKVKMKTYKSKIPCIGTDARN